VSGDTHEPNEKTVDYVTDTLGISLRSTYSGSLVSSLSLPPKPFDLFEALTDPLEEFGARRFLHLKKTSKRLMKEQAVAEEEDDDSDSDSDEEEDPDPTKEQEWTTFAEQDLERLCKLTDDMDIDEYLLFQEARTSSLVNYKRTKFCQWLSIPENTNGNYILILGWLAIFRIKKLVFGANLVRLKKQVHPGLFSCLPTALSLLVSDFGIHQEECVVSVEPTFSFSLSSYVSLYRHREEPLLIHAFWNELTGVVSSCRDCPCKERFIDNSLYVSIVK